MLPADVYSRVMRLLGHDVTYICATDEHGTPAELAAQAAGVSVQEYCDEQYEIQRKAGEGFSLAFDWFGRTSRPANHAVTQHLAQALEKQGLIEERTSKQVYSVDDGRFLPDRYVEGTCPTCGFEKARGDQCDNCGRLLDPVDLIDPYSAVSGSRNIEIRDTNHLYLLQGQMQDRIREWVKSKGAQWPSLAVSIANKWLDEGLIARSITRDLSWGVKVTDKDGNPRPGYENKVFYVWFDAPIGYISATQEWAEATGNDWESLWKTDKGADEVEYVQFMGKDNVAFHTVSFPVTLLGCGEPWKTVDKLKAFNWVTWYGGKFSTSMKRGVFMDQALELLPADYWRWYLNFKTDPVQAALGVRVGINLVRLCAIAAQPVIPDAAGKILSALGLEGAQGWPAGDAKTLLAALEPGQSFTPAEILFAKIEDDQVADWAERFGGAE
jgi:methionyl-tRNA synthetase